jgi:hypothetical protein
MPGASGISVPPRIPDNIRQEVIRRRIFCEPYDKIASDLGISHGAAIDIEKGWRNGIGASDADAILDLARTLHRLGISPTACADGAQIWAILNELGVRPEMAKGFLSDLTGAVIAKGMAASTVADILSQLTELSQRFSLPLEQVPGALESACKNLAETEGQISDRASELQKVQAELQSTYDDMHTTRENMAMFLEVESRLGGLGLSLAKIDDVVNVIHSAEKMGNDPVKIAAALASTNSLEERKEDLEAEIQSLQENLKNIEGETAAISTRLAGLRELQTFLDEFITLGFDQSRLQQLLGVIKEVAAQRAIPLPAAASAFLAEVKADYDLILGYTATLKGMEDRAKQVGEQLAKNETAFAEYRDAINSWMFLYEKGIREKELIYWQKVFHDHPDLSPEMLSESLRGYADIREAITSMGTIRDNLASTSLALRADIATLQKEKASAIEEIERARRRTADDERQRIERLQLLLKQEQELIIQSAAGAAREVAKKALLEGISLREANSPLLPVVSWENGGRVPQADELIRAGGYVLAMLERVLGPSDPLKADLANAVKALNKKLDGNSGSTPGNSSSSSSAAFGRTVDNGASEK